MITLERKKRFAESILWELQRRYFIEHGIDAWSGAVPFYITSNPFIANCYATMAIRYIQDHVKQGAYDSSEPFYIIELGTGSGQFSYYMMKRLFEMQKILKLEDVKICYVMTDFTDSNVNFWEQHKKLQPFVAAGKLDYALFNLEETETIHLIHQNKTLSEKNVKNPFVVCANYIFDTVSHDAFRVVNGVLQESVITCETEANNMRDKMPLDMEKLKTSFDHRPAKTGYYKDENLNQVIFNYPNLMNNSSFLIPMGGIRCMRHFMKMTNNNMLVLSTDKAYTDLSELQGLGDPHIAFHGSFSMMVNLHAMGEYFLACGGDCYHQTLREGIKSSVFIAGKKLDELPETKQAVDVYLEQFGPGDHFHFHRYIVRTMQPKNWLHLIASHLNISHWDPYAYGYVSHVVNEEINGAPPVVLENFMRGMGKMDENFYYMPGVRDTYFDIAAFYATVKEYDKALTFYEKSIEYYGEKPQTLFNMALCYYFREDKQQALIYFEKSYEIDEEKNEKTKEWIDRVKGEVKY